MNIRTKINKGSFIELHIKIGKVKIKEYLAKPKNGNWKVPESDIEQFIMVANKCSRFNGVPDVEFVEKILDAFLTNDERLELLHNYCQYCGQNKKTNGECYCSPKFDE